jgi:hypothetical protein
MAEKDLIPQNLRTKEEQKKIASMGGHASVKVRRAKKELKERIVLALQFLTDQQAKMADSPEQKKIIKDVGYDTFVVLKELKKGNLQAVDRFWDRLYGKPEATNKIEGNISINSLLGEVYDIDTDGEEEVVEQRMENEQPIQDCEQAGGSDDISDEQSAE